MSSEADNISEKYLNQSNNQKNYLYSLKKEDTILLIMDYLKNEGYDRTYVSLEEESGINLFNYDENLAILRGFILDGDWEEAEKSLESFQNEKNFPFKNLIFEIRKEKLIEEVETQQTDGTFDGLAKELKDLQDLGCNNEFNTLMDYLKETEHDVLNNIISRRLDIFNKIREQITFQYPISDNEINITPNKLKEIICKICEKLITLSRNKFDNKNILTLKDFDNLLKLKIETDINGVRLDTDPNKNTIIYNNNCKDSFRTTDLNESNNNNNTDRNKNKSKTKSTKSRLERLAETYDDLDLHLQYEDSESKNLKNRKKTKKIEKKEKQEQTNIITNNYNYNCNYNYNHNYGKGKNYYEESHINNGNNGNLNPNNIYKNINNINNNNDCDDSNEISEYTNVNYKKNDHDLSDLDQDEYFLKNCYDYYNYDITSLALKKVIEDSHPIRCSCFSPKGEYFAIGTNSKCVKIFDLTHILDNFTKRNSIFSNVNQNNMTSILSNTLTSKLNKETIGMIFEQKNHHFGSIFCIDWSSSGKLLATGSNDKTIKLMNIPELEDNKKLINDHETFELQITGNQGTVRSLCFEPTNDLVLLSANNGENTIKLWDTIKGINIACLEGHSAEANIVKWSNDSQLFASSGLDKTVRFWDIREYKNTNILSAIQYADINDISIFSKNNNTTIAVGHSDGLVTIWDYSKQCVIKEIYDHNEEVRSISFSPDGKYLLSGSFDSKIKIYDVNKNFNLIGELEHSDKVVSCKWHPEIPLIVSTSADKTARVWIPSKY